MRHSRTVAFLWILAHLGCGSAAGLACKTNADCTRSWTECKDGTCKCLQLFQPIDQEGSLRCEPIEFFCPDGQPSHNDHQRPHLPNCEVKLSPDTIDILNDTCPDGSFCNYWPNTMTEVRRLPGHCCPTPKRWDSKPTCPIGAPHETGQCHGSGAAVAGFGLYESRDSNCPKDSHMCIHGVCCPRGCAQGRDYFNHNGTCARKAALDEECTMESQCVRGAACVDGKCQCKPIYKRMNTYFCITPGSKVAIVE